ncbi:MAG: hypothetical protein AAF919_03315 [Pseudomonadota bacterium]
MRLDRFVLILLIVLVAAGATLWLAALIASTFVVPGAALAILPVLLVAFVAFRIIRDRMTSREDDHYDRMEGDQ